MKLADYSTYIGVLAGALGILLLFSPSLLKKFDEWSSKMVTRFDTTTFKYRIGFGVSLLIISLFLFFMGHYFKVKGR